MPFELPRNVPAVWKRIRLSMDINKHREGKTIEGEE